MGLDLSGAAVAGLDDVWIDCALCKELDVAYFCSLLLEDADEERADDFPLCLWAGDACECGEEAFLGVDADEVEVFVFEEGLYLVWLAFAHEAVIDEDAVELVADCAVDELCGDCAVDATREGEKDFMGAYLGAKGADGFVLVVRDVPVWDCLADVEKEVSDDFLAMEGVGDLWMELDAVEFFLWCSAAAFLQECVEAVLTKPGGSWSTESAWLAQAVAFGGRSLKRGEF